MKTIVLRFRIALLMSTSFILISCSGKVVSDNFIKESPKLQVLSDSCEFQIHPARGCSGKYILGEIDSLQVLVLEGDYENLVYGRSYQLSSVVNDYYLVRSQDVPFLFCSDIKILGGELDSPQPVINLRVEGELIVNAPVREYNAPLIDVYISSIRIRKEQIRIKAKNFKFANVNVFATPG